MNDTTKEPSRQKLNILLGEDDVLSQQIASLLLARLGLSADLVFNGAEALAAAKAHDYDLIFLDMHMPIMGGPEAAREIRKLDGEKKNVPIIAMTASDLIDVEQRCTKAGMNGCIIKPLDLQRLSQVISDCVEGKYRVKPLPMSIPEKENYPINGPALDLKSALPIFGNDLSQYKTFLEEFIKGLPERLQKIETAHRKHDWTALEREAHTLRGTAASVGALKLADIAARLEHRSRGKSSELIPIAKTICDIRDMIKELEKARNTLPLGISQEQKLSRGFHAGLPDRR
jgi:CheY-like chemotaxis protein